MIDHDYREHAVLRFRPPRIALSLLVLAAVLHMLLPLALHKPLVLTAALTAATGFAIMLRAWWLFRCAATPVCPTDRPVVLVTRDIFAWSRNPMYLGIGLIMIASGLLAGSLPLYAAAFAFFAIIGRHFIPYEESRLREIFGEEFANYCRRVRRWL